MWARAGVSMISNWLLARRVRNARPDRSGMVVLPDLFELALTPGVPVTVSFIDANVPRDRAARLIGRLNAITIADRAAFEPMLWEHYNDSIEASLDYYGSVEAILAAESGNDPVFAGAVPATCPQEVWSLIRCHEVVIWNYDDEDEPMWAEVRAWAAWDSEHGCAFIFNEDGTLDGGDRYPDDD